VKWYRLGLPFRKLDSLDGRPVALFQRWLDHPEMDAYWKNMIPFEEEFKKIDIPVLTTTGYFDDDQRGAMHYYSQHMRWNPTAEHYLVIGPYDHVGGQGMLSDLVLGYAIDSAARININDLVWDWFDYTLRNGKKPAQLKDKINYQAMGTNTWKSAKDLSALSNDSIVLYLSHRYSGKGFLLSRFKPMNEDWLEHVTDFKDRPVVDYKMMAQSKTPPHQRENLIFMSEPLEQDILMNGSLQGNMQLSMNKKDADLLFELYELTPDSNYFQLSYTYQRISFLLNPGKRKLLVPGKTYDIPVYNSFMTSRLLHKGSRLVLYAGPMKDFNYELNYGSGKPVSEESIQDAKEPLVIKWSNRSHIKIPVLK
jgi:putative CocE/NonD family hydrolase